MSGNSLQPTQTLTTRVNGYKVTFVAVKDGSFEGYDFGNGGSGDTLSTPNQDGNFTKSIIMGNVINGYL